ncbi:RING-H2 finger protein ATL66-like [Diospyros lotus]|uniref:RING-H2 finger protein ATL66-like n=1 Tax=Diospyros lotus TaxID=55363 RepID=UPI002257506C|nr:RING-H2 finger protein ATL66-like [Diospyros lotus]
MSLILSSIFVFSFKIKYGITLSPSRRAAAAAAFSAVEKYRHSQQTVTVQFHNELWMVMASQESQPYHWHYTEFDDRNFQISGRTFFSVVVLFSIIILLITLLLIYARWVCSFRRLPTGAAPPPPPQPQGLDAATISGLPIKLHHSSATTTSIGEWECCICLGIFQDGEKVKVLPKCHHCYHSECVDKWLSSQSSCPLCRSSLRARSPV